MIKIGGKEFKNDEDLAIGLEKLVEVGEKKISEGLPSGVFEGMINHWDALVTAAIANGQVAKWVRDRFMDALYKNANKPYPNASL